ncbi:MAG: hypothetical protein IJ304_02040 [Clostridia bacterium]|nr:hypothetical protein [Clostridia bacterium]
MVNSPPVTDSVLDIVDVIDLPFRSRTRPLPLSWICSVNPVTSSNKVSVVLSVQFATAVAKSVYSTSPTLATKVPSAANAVKVKHGINVISIASVIRRAANLFNRFFIVSIPFF